MQVLASVRRMPEFLTRAFLKTGRSRMRPKTGIRLRKESAVGMKPANRHQKPYVSTIIPTMAQPHTTSPTPLRKNKLPCTVHTGCCAPARSLCCRGEEWTRGVQCAGINILTHLLSKRAESLQAGKITFRFFLRMKNRTVACGPIVRATPHTNISCMHSTSYAGT